MGLNIDEKTSAEISDLLNSFSNVFRSGMESSGGIRHAEPEPFDPGAYFESNTLKDGNLSDEDLVTVSRKTENGYKAVFVKLGDLKKFLLET